MIRSMLESVLITTFLLATAAAVVDSKPSFAEGTCEDNINRTDRTMHHTSDGIEDPPLFEWNPNMSLLDVLNPDILSNQTLLDEIGEALHDHKLVVLRDAFQPAFAGYVWNELNRNDLSWPLWEEWLGDGFAFHHHNFYDMQVRNGCLDVLVWKHPGV